MSKPKRSNALNIIIWTPDGGDVPDEVAKEITTLVDNVVKENRLLQIVVKT